MSDLAIELEDCSYSYDSRAMALQGVSCCVERGSWIALIGPNGSGKSTLAKLCNGLLRPQRGRVSILGEDVQQRPVGEIARQVGYLFQNPDHQIFAPTVREEIAFGLENLGFSTRETEWRVEEALAQFGLESFADRPPAMLGYGLRRQLTVASLLALRPPILILDEPTTGLDWAHTRVVLDCMQALHQAGHTILLVTHDMQLVAEQADYVLLLNQGQLVAHGPTRQVFGQPGLLAEVSAAPPPVTRLSQEMKPWGIRGDSLTVEAFFREYIGIASAQGQRS
jgi:energy-coupling factor transporter ATP-binding protein EcfA2